VPHEGNGHHPHVLKHRVLFGFAAIVFGLKVLAVTATVLYPSYGSQALSLTAANVLSLANQARAAAGAQALRLSVLLNSSAQAKADDMAKNGYFAHTSPSGLTPWSFIRGSGYRYVRSAENLAVHYQTAEAAQGSWMASPSHRANIMNPAFVDLGVGIARGVFEGADTLFVVEHFGQPFVEPEAAKHSASSTPALIQAAAVAPSTVATGTAAAVVATAPEKAAVAKAVDRMEEPIKAAIKPAANGLALGVTDAAAKKVVASVGAEKVELEKKPDGQWSGMVPAESLSGAEPKTLTVVSVRGDGVQAEQVVAVLGQGSPVETAGTTQKVFGVFTAADLDALMRMIGALLLGMITLALAAYATVRMHVARPKVVGHALVTVTLIAVLLSMK